MQRGRSEENGLFLLTLASLVQVPGMDSRYDNKYSGLGAVSEEAAMEEEMHFAPLPDYGDEGLGGAGDDASVGGDSSVGFGTQQYYGNSTQGSQSSDIGSYMAGSRGEEATQNTQFSQESGYSDYYFDGGFSQN